MRKMHNISFNRDNIVIYRLSAGQQGHLSLRAGVYKSLLRVLGVGLADAVTIEHGDKLRALFGGQGRQLIQQPVQLPLRAEQLPVCQSQIVAGIDGEAVEVGSGRHR